MEKPAASPLLAVLRGARRLFDKLCSKPHAAGSLFGGAIGQHAVMPPWVRCFCAAPNIDVVHPGETATLLVWFRIDDIVIRLIVYVCCFIFCGGENPVFCVEKKASRSTLVDVRSDAQSRIAIVLTNTVWFCLWWADAYRSRSTRLIILNGCV
jgi:hypothetical protein